MTRVRVVLALVLAAVLVGAGSTAAWGLWTVQKSTGSTVKIGKMSAGLTGTDAMTTTFSDTVTSTTKPVTLTNSGTIAGTTSTSVSVVSGSSQALAKAVNVSAWPVASTAVCTASSAVGSGAVTGTWASLPSMSSALAPGASAVWCVRSTPATTAPPSSTTNVTLSLAVVAGGWTSTVVNGGFSLNTSAATSAVAMGCVDHSGNYLDLTWDTSTRPIDTWYGAFIANTMVGAKSQGYSGSIQLSSSQVPTSLAADGVATVEIRVLDSSGTSGTELVAKGHVTLYVQNDTRAIRCGA